MNIDNYLNYDRLAQFLDNLKTLFATKKEVKDKVDKVSGKGLSTNDYTTDDKIKLSNIASGAEVNVQSDWDVADETSDAYIKNKPSIPIYAAATAAPEAHGTAAAGTSDKYAREDHVHPLQTTISGNAGSAAKLQTARKIGNGLFDGSKDITLNEIGAAPSVHKHEDYIPIAGYNCTANNYYLVHQFSALTSRSVPGDPGYDAFAISSQGIISLQEAYGDPFEIYMIASTGYNLSNMSYPADFSDDTASGYYSFSPHCFYPFFHFHDASTLSKCSLGTNYAKWSDIYAVNGVIQTSDRSLKDDIIPISNKYAELFKLLQPVSFQFRDGTSGRTHTGFIAQDVEDAMKQAGLTDLEFAGFCKDKKINIVRDENGKRQEEPVLDEDGNSVYIYSLRYEEFIALNTAMIQKQQKEIKSLEDRISVLESRSMALTASLSE